jgi:CheY-like chemotaxis protein
MRRDPRTREIPVVVITSLPQWSIHEAARRAGADEVRLIPMDVGQLAQLIRRLVPGS